MDSTSVTDISVSSKTCPSSTQPNQADMNLAQDGDINSILELNKSEYGPTDILATPTDFAWRYNRNPAGQALVPVVRNDVKEIIGCIWIVPLKLRIKGQNYLAATGTNLLIHSEYRNTFVYTKLLRQFHRILKKQNFPLHFSFVSEEAYLQQQQRSPQTAWTVPLLVKPLNFSLLLRTYWGNSWLYHFIKPVDWLASKFFSPYPGKGTGDKIVIRVVKQFDATFNKLWGDFQDKYPVMLIRDWAFLTWRFTNTSHRQYRILVAETEAKMLGYVVLRCTNIRGVNAGLVLDFLVTDDVLGAKAAAGLLAQAETYFREQQMAVSLGLMAPFAVEYRHLQQAGYIYLPPKFSPRPFRFAFFLHDDTQPGLNSLSERDWFITFADYESF